MAYDPADLKLPPWLLHVLDKLVRYRLPLGGGWRLGMTRPGVMLTAALLGIWAAAVYSANNLLYLCGAMLSALVAASLWRGIGLLRRISDVSGLELPTLQAGSAAMMQASILAPRGYPALFEAEAEFEFGSFPLAGRWQDGSVQLRGRIATVRRGVYPMRTLRLATAAPLGLFVASRELDGACSLTVLPVTVPWQDAAHAFAQMREGDEWRDLRAYAQGDPLSRVHWRKASADGRGWTVKRFGQDEPARQSSILRVDLRLPAQLGMEDFESLLGKACFWMHNHGNGRLILDQRHFDLADPKDQAQARMALALAEPAGQPPAGAAGMMLSLWGAG